MSVPGSIHAILAGFADALDTADDVDALIDNVIEDILGVVSLDVSEAIVGEGDDFIIARLGEGCEWATVFDRIDGYTVTVSVMAEEEETVTLAKIAWGRNDDGFESLEGDVLDDDDEPTGEVRTIDAVDIYAIQVH